MHTEIYKMENLPLTQMQEVGLAKDGKLLIDQEDLQALLSGRRTDMITLRSLSVDGQKLPEIHSKVSLTGLPDGESKLVFHPIYKQVDNPEFLTVDESESLQKKEVSSINKIIQDDWGNPKEIIAEFDEQTNEFVITDSRRLLTPELVNNEYLNEKQKEMYKQGKRVVLSEGTQFQFTGNGRKSIQANKPAVVMSVSNSNGVSYVHYDNLPPLDGKRNQNAGQLSEGYYKHLDEFATQTAIKDINKEIDPDLENEQSMGYKKPGISR